MRQGKLLIALLLATACSGPGPADTEEALHSAMSAHQAGLAVTGVRPVSTTPTNSAPAVPAPARTGPRGAFPSTAEHLVGHTPDAVLRWLGEPRLRRAEGPAEIWHYQAEQCHLEVFLYREEGARPALRVAFAAARAVGTARRGEAVCLGDIGRAAAEQGPAPAAPARAMATGI